MPSRLWLFLAFIVAFGATRAHAETPPPPDRATVAGTSATPPPAEPAHGAPRVS